MTDYAEHLIAARKALATAEACAALGRWQEAAHAFFVATVEADNARAVCAQLGGSGTQSGMN